jgi:hypothetical protein
MRGTDARMATNSDGQPVINEMIQVQANYYVLLEFS